MDDERRQGHSKLIYDKEKRAIVTVVPSGTAAVVNTAVTAIDPELIYYAISPSGERVTISRELFRALNIYLGPTKKTGKIEVECRNGGVCGVRATEVFK